MSQLQYCRFLFVFVALLCIAAVLPGCNFPLEDSDNTTPDEEETTEEPSPPSEPPPALTRQLFDSLHYGLGYWEVYDILGQQEEHHRETVLMDDLPNGARPYTIVWRTWRLANEPGLCYRLGFIDDSLEEKKVVEWEDRFDVKPPAYRLRHPEGNENSPQTDAEQPKPQ